MLIKLGSIYNLYLIAGRLRNIEFKFEFPKKEMGSSETHIRCYNWYH